MPILVDTVRIAGFRGIQDFEMSLPRVAVLIGPNNLLVFDIYGSKKETSTFHSYMVARKLARKKERI